MDHRKIINKYIDQVMNGKQVVGNIARLRVQRHLNDLQNCYDRGMFFDEAAALRVLRFFSFLKHSKGRDFAGKPFVLAPWQMFDIYCIYGWKREGNIRRFRYAYTDIARKNGKTTFAAGQALYLLIMDNEPGAEIYTVATKREQARICFDESRNIIQQSNDLKKYSEVLRNAITFEANGSSMKPLSSDANTLDGLNPHGIVLDEFHAHKDDLVFNVMKSAMGSRSNPLMLLLTTAGFNRFSPCYNYRDVAIKVLNNTLQQDDLFASIHTLDDDDDFEDQQNWIKSNPNLDISVKLSFLQDEYKSAKNNPSQLYNFLTKNLNIWTDSAKQWLPFDKIEEANKGIDDLTGAECYGGLDLATMRDTNALALMFRLPNGQSTYKLILWMPEMNVEERVKNKGINYDAWIRSGHIRITPGNVTDYEFIKADILQLKQQYKIKSIAFDRWNSSQLVIDLQNEGITMHPFGQGYGSMSAPTKEFERQIMSGTANLEGNPVLAWHLSNVSLQRDPAGNIKIDKDKSSEKVDGAVACVMALGNFMIANGADKKPDINEIYKNKTIRTL
jgi:phage terminase large subunit-like protein